MADPAVTLLNSGEYWKNRAADPTPASDAGFRLSGSKSAAPPPCPQRGHSIRPRISQTLEAESALSSPREGRRPEQSQRIICASRDSQRNSGSVTDSQTWTEGTDVLDRRKADVERRVALADSLEHDRSGQAVGRLRTPRDEGARELDIRRPGIARANLERVTWIDRR